MKRLLLIVAGLTLTLLARCKPGEEPVDGAATLDSDTGDVEPLDTASDVPADSRDGDDTSAVRCNGARSVATFDDLASPGSACDVANDCESWRDHNTYCIHFVECMPDTMTWSDVFVDGCVEHEPDVGSQDATD